MYNPYESSRARARGADGTAFRAIPRPAFTSVDAGAGGLSKFLQNFGLRFTSVTDIGLTPVKLSSSGE